jgi:hypothetical protein
MSRKPNLFIVGAPKCGTTAWYEYLRRHPDIAFSDAKEPHYFCTDLPGFRWARTEESYLKLFEDLPDKKYIGEASIMYLYSRVAIRNIHKFNPDAKILIFIRNYETFFQSYHSQLYLTHDEDEPDLQRAWELQAERLKGKSIPSGCREKLLLQYRDVGRFGEQAKRAVKVFPRSQVKIIVFEEWTKDPHGTYSDLMKFLGLVNDGFAAFEPKNTKLRTRNRVLGKWLHRPPRFVLGISKFIRRILGIDRLHLAQKIRSINEVKKDSHQKLSDDLSFQISCCYCDDRLKLEEILDRSITDWDQKKDASGPSEKKTQIKGVS